MKETILKLWALFGRERFACCIFSLHSETKYSLRIPKKLIDLYTSQQIEKFALMEARMCLLHRQVDIFSKLAESCISLTEPEKLFDPELSQKLKEEIEKPTFHSLSFSEKEIDILKKVDESALITKDLLDQYPLINLAAGLPFKTAKINEDDLIDLSIAAININGQMELLKSFDPYSVSDLKKLIQLINN